MAATKKKVQLPDMLFQKSQLIVYGALKIGFNVHGEMAEVVCDQFPTGCFAALMVGADGVVASSIATRTKRGADNQYEAETRAHKIGLWSHPNPIPPWDFRRRKSNTTNRDSKTISTGVYRGNNR
jgi:hypothetical protein